MNEFSVGSCIRFGWDTFKKRPWFFIGITVLLGIIWGLSSQINSSIDSLQSPTGLIDIVMFIIGVAISVLLKMGSIKYFLKAHDNPEAAEIEDLWAPHPFWEFFIAGLVVGGIVLVGLILLIIPGIMWSLRFMFVPYLIMDRKLEMSEAFSESGRITKGHKWQLFALLLALGGINVLGILCLLVGLLVSIPVTYLATIHAYRTLEHKANEVAAPASA